ALRRSCRNGRCLGLIREVRSRPFYPAAVTEFEGNGQYPLGPALRRTATPDRLPAGNYAPINRTSECTISKAVREVGLNKAKFNCSRIVRIPLSVKSWFRKTFGYCFLPPS